MGTVIEIGFGLFGFALGGWWGALFGVAFGFCINLLRGWCIVQYRRVRWALILRRERQGRPFTASMQAFIARAQEEQRWREWTARR